MDERKNVCMMYLKKKCKNSSAAIVMTWQCLSLCMFSFILVIILFHFDKKINWVMYKMRSVYDWKKCVC